MTTREGALVDRSNAQQVRSRPEIFGLLSEEAGAGLCPIGEADRRNRYLGIAPNGAVRIGMDNATLLAETAGEALVLRGIVPRWMP